MLGFYPLLIRKSREQGVDLSSFLYAQLDNYVWRPGLYPDGPGREDFIPYLHKNILDPAHIPAERFFPINGVTDSPEAEAKRYDDWLSKQTIAAVFLGLGPAPEVHLAYIKSGTPLESRTHYVKISDVVITRNTGRGEHAPTEAITVGIANIREAKHKFVLAIDKEKEISLALDGPVITDVVASALRTDGFGKSVHLYTDSSGTITE
jgi:6-phosphogluconolactonase/glucosamine-6-phosphate isomerase/deaminase